MKRIYLTMGCSALVLGAAMAQPAFAADEQGAAPAEEAVGLSEIIVTAQKRSESLQKAAIAVTAVSSETLQRAAVTDATQLTNLAPSLSINSTYGPSANFYVRGVGNLVLNPSSDPAVIVNLDGVPLARPTGVQGMFFDLERIEVLKGPQGTLYGRNATGGAVNVITAQPKFNELSGFANVSYGNYDALKANVAVNLPIGDNHALRVAGMRSKRDGTYSDGTGDENLSAFRISMASKLTDTLKTTISFDYANQAGKGPGTTLEGLDYNQRIGLFDQRADVFDRLVTAAPYPFGAAGFVGTAGAVLQPLFTVPGAQPRMDNDFWGFRLQADLETSLGTVSFIPSHRRADLDYTGTSGPTAMSTEKDKQTSVELRLVSPAENQLQYIFGALYFNERVASSSQFNFQYTQFHADIAPKTDSYAAYARLTYKLTDALRLSGGLRYTIDKRSTNDLNINEQVLCPGFVFDTPPYSVNPPCVGTPILPVSTQLYPGTLVPSPAGHGFINLGYAGVNGAFLQTDYQPNSGKKTFKKLTWRAAVEYDVAPASLLYASVETGFKAGGFFNSPNQQRNSFNPETIIAYTIGSKNRFMGNRLQLNLEAFWWEYKNQQISHFILEGTTPVFATENIGKSRFRGIEAEMRAQITDNTEINGTIQYLDAENTSFTYLNALPPTTGCGVTPPAAPGASYTVNCSGKRPSNAPEWVLQGGIQQTIPLGESGDILLSANTRYQTGAYTGIELLQSQYQKAFFTSGAQIEYRTAGGRLSVAAFVDNIENNDTMAWSQPHSFAGNQLLVNLQMPRTYGARVGYKF